MMTMTCFCKLLQVHVTLFFTLFELKLLEAVLKNV